MTVAIPVPSFVWPIVFGANALLIACLVLAVRRYGGVHARGLALGVGAALAAWCATMITLSASGVFVAGTDRPPTIELGLLPPLVIGGLALLLSRSVQAEALAIPQPWLVAVQSLRMLGVVFVILLRDGVLPRQFALPAGWGDFVVGALAPVVALALMTERSWARPLAVAWNVLGIADLVVAVGMGALSAPSAIRVFHGTPSTGAMAQLPLSMIPVFAVPIFLLLHLISLLGLIRARNPSLAHAPARTLRART
ncbi:MAG TPA: hypothetical protein VMK42_02145 [Anaeromyxobacteraceae bacterium]|nr:hypothetical protein [Anaeromyxobacteraceae bacterium]